MVAAAAVAAAVLAQVRHVSRHPGGILALYWQKRRGGTQCRRLRRISEVDAMHRLFRPSPTPTRLAPLACDASTATLTRQGREE